MAKKKSKTQKQKRSIKKRNAKELQKTMMLKSLNEESLMPNKEKQLVEKNKVDYNVALNSSNNKKKEKKQVENVLKKTDKSKQLVDKSKVKYNVVLNAKPKKSKSTGMAKKTNKKLNFKDNKSSIKVSVFNLITTKSKKDSIPSKNEKTNQNKKNITQPRKFPFNILNLLKNNFHILFNSLIILTFIVFLIGLIRIHAFNTSTIVYITSLIVFLIIIAISYNKYTSGKVFTILLCLAMGISIYKMQYTYDFINNLNVAFYENKTYYVVTFDNNSNRSIYTLNNKKIGLMQENSTNVERLLDTKLDDIKYIEYENINLLFKDFFSQQFRALIVNENQYKYLMNNIEENTRAVKILYEFEANARK